jgi:integrase
LRPGETVGLKREYLHADHLDVEGAMLREGGEAGTWSTRLKTDHLHHFAHRRIPLVPELSAALSALVARHPGQEFVFIDDEGRTKGRPITEGMTEDIARDLSLDLGVRYVTPVGYRHTFASVCRHRGMPYEALAKLMGHANTTEIIRTYGHPVTDMAAPDLARFVA